VCRIAVVYGRFRRRSKWRRRFRLSDHRSREREIGGVHVWVTRSTPTNWGPLTCRLQEWFTVTDLQPFKVPGIDPTKGIRRDRDGVHDARAM